MVTKIQSKELSRSPTRNSKDRFSITRSRKSYLTSAFRVILGFQLLSIHIKGVSVRIALRIVKTIGFKPDDLNGHLKIFEKMRKEEIWPINSYSVIKNTDFHRQLGVQISIRCDI